MILITRASAREHLDRAIQTGDSTVGHSSVEDSLATLDLVRVFVLNKASTAPLKSSWGQSSFIPAICVRVRGQCIHIDCRIIVQILVVSLSTSQRVHVYARLPYSLDPCPRRSVWLVSRQAWDDITTIHETNALDKCKAAMMIHFSRCANLFVPTCLHYFLVPRLRLLEQPKKMRREPSLLSGSPDRTYHFKNRLLRRLL